MALGPTCLADIKLGSECLGSKYLMGNGVVDTSIDDRPSWLDVDKFRRGRQFFLDHFHSIAWAFFCSLIIGFAVPNLSDILEFTGESVGPEKAKKRYLQTFAHLISWHDDDIFERGSVGYNSIRTVRAWHDSTRRRLDKAYGAKPSHISQYDMALVQCGFIGSVVLHPTVIGIGDDANLIDYCYYWKVVGHVLGIEDRFNVCFTESVHDTRAICHQIEQEIIVPSLYLPSKQYYRLANDILSGYMQNIGGPSQLLDLSVMHGFTFPAMGLPTPKMGLLKFVVLVCIRIHFLLCMYLPFYRKHVNNRSKCMLRNLKPVVGQYY